MKKKIYYKVQAGAFDNKTNAEQRKKKLKDNGFNVEIIKSDGMFKVQCGAFENKQYADNLAAKIKAKNIEAIVVKTVIEVDEKDVSVGAEKVYGLMKPYIDSKNAHADFVDDYNKFIDEYNKKHKTKHSKISLKDAGCTEFVDLMFFRAGLLELIGYAKQSKGLMDNAKKNGTWKDGANDIKFGDVVIYMNSHGEPNHTEFAIGDHDFISGNCRGGVHKRHRSSLKTVKGRIRPKY